MSREHLVRSLLELQPRPRAKGVTHMALFGSRARKDNRPDSDVAIDVDPHAKFSLIDLVGVELAIADETALSANVFMKRGFDEGFLQTFTRDAIEIF